MKILKRLLLLVAVILTGIAAVGGVFFHLTRRNPAIYRPYTFKLEERRIINQKAVDKLNRAQRVAQQAWSAEEQAIRAGATQPATKPPQPETVTFTEEEVNAFLLHNFKDDVEQYVSDPGVFLPDGLIVLAAKLKDRDQVMSFHLRPAVDDAGKLRITLEGIYLGRAPVPQFMLASKLDAIRTSLNEKLPDWKQSARMEPSGLANDSTFKASMAELLLAIMDAKPAESVLFVPRNLVGGDKALPVRLAKVEVKESALTLVLEPMGPEQRKAALEKIRTPRLDATAKTAPPEQTKSASVDQGQ